MGSVKDLEVIERPHGIKMGRGRFHFSDRFSVFDWGPMPDEIPDKGRALCVTSSYFFERLEERGVRTHYIGIVENGKVRHLDELDGPSDVMEIRLVRVIRPNVMQGSYDYTPVASAERNYLIPIEFIYRNSLPEGSSVFERLKKGLRIEYLGLNRIPDPGERLEKPIFDVSTKLEDTDRYITWDEARELGGLSEEEIEEIKKILATVSNVVNERISKAGLWNDDGKIEMAFDSERKLMVVDSVGTLDECRFTYGGRHVSKEILRMIYRKTQWYDEICRAKERSMGDWRKLCSPPPPLPGEVIESIGNLYKSMSDEITGMRFFDSPPLRKVLKDVFNTLMEFEERAKNTNL